MNQPSGPKYESVGRQSCLILSCPILLRKDSAGGAMRLQIHTIVSMPFAENTYVVWPDGSRKAVVIDPGTEPDAILGFLADRGLTPEAILNTHGHADHIAGNADLKTAYPEP